MPAQYNDMISGIFPGEVIIVENGKVSLTAEWWWYAQLLKRYLFPRNLCYHASQETIWLQKEAPYGVKLGEGGAPKPFLDCGGQGCRIDLGGIAMI